MPLPMPPVLADIVAPFAGAWIEILNHTTKYLSITVAPFAGAWIEIIGEGGETVNDRSRSLRGSVD